MQVTNVSICPTDAANDAGRPALTPELLAAVGARYSRDNEGLESILKRVEGMDSDKAVDNIFKLADYGHASIYGMVPVSLFVDDISIYDAYYLWSICPQASGQESSTRYIKLSAEGLIDPNLLGIKDSGNWHNAMLEAFTVYESALLFWGRIAEENPGLMRIPPSLLNDVSEKARKQVARMKRNYVFDRARIFLPVAAKTNVMMVQNAQAWMQTVQNLLSHPLPSLNALGEEIKKELTLTTPRSLKHAVANSSAQAVLKRAFDRTVEFTRYKNHESFGNKQCEVFLKADVAGVEDILLEDARDRTNRYSLFGENICSVPVTYTFRGISMGEMRDMNRHRTGSKISMLSPLGFYTAEDQLPEGVDCSEYQELIRFGKFQSKYALQLLKEGDPSYIYYTLLGTQYCFMHTTTLDKFIYTMELRTGVGAHYRYAAHCHDLLEKFYAKIPGMREVIFEGSAEPE